ncbi:alpha/beta hydrolase family protein [Oceanimonas baumannii]|uniref:alpha/beta hydrolase family protein n=1 Tax=Oceanimonas baumannii TaxID=129578 RepID=UPI003A8E09CB
MSRKILWTLCVFSPASLANIGIAEEHYHDAERKRMIEARVLYPTATSASARTFAENPAFYGFKAVENATPAGSQLPVYILVHGTSGSWKNLSWLGSYLAEQGALVVSANHPDYTTGQATPERVLRMWEQPRDVSFLIDEILSGKYAQYVDKKDITVIGYSLGGYTALALAGARFDIAGYQNYCSQHRDISCHFYKNAFESLSPEDHSMISGDYSDERVMKSVAIAPGYVPAVIPNALTGLSADTVIVGAELDKTIPPQLQIKPYIGENINNLHYQEVAGASHFSFIQNCKPQAIAILEEEDAAFVCEEAENVDRRSLHQSLIEIVEQL